jgi:hypothetical protein
MPVPPLRRRGAKKDGGQKSQSRASHEILSQAVLMLLLKKANLHVTDPNVVPAFQTRYPVRTNFWAPCGPLPPMNDMNALAWFSSMISTARDSGDIRNNPLRVPESITVRSAVGKRRRELVGGLAFVAKVWSELLLVDSPSELCFKIDIGFGLQSTKLLKSSDTATIALGFLDFLDPKPSVVFEFSKDVIGGLHGPLALVNSACSQHANCVFTKAWNSKDANFPYAVSVKKLEGRKIEQGQEFLINYSVEGVATCAFPGCNRTIKGNR